MAQMSTCTALEAEDDVQSVSTLNYSGGGGGLRTVMDACMALRGEKMFMPHTERTAVVAHCMTSGRGG